MDRPYRFARNSRRIDHCCNRLQPSASCLLRRCNRVVAVSLSRLRHCDGMTGNQGRGWVSSRRPVSGIELPGAVSIGGSIAGPSGAAAWRSTAPPAACGRNPRRRPLQEPGRPSRSRLPHCYGWPGFVTAGGVSDGGFPPGGVSASGRRTAAVQRRRGERCSGARRPAVILPTRSDPGVWRLGF